MSKVTIELSPEQINQAVESLPAREKLRLTEQLEKETIRLRWRKILKDIDSRLRRFPVSKKEVIQEIQAYRKQKHAQGSN